VQVSADATTHLLREAFGIDCGIGAWRKVIAFEIGSIIATEAALHLHRWVCARRTAQRITDEHPEALHKFSQTILKFILWGRTYRLKSRRLASTRRRVIHSKAPSFSIILSVRNLRDSLVGLISSFKIQVHRPIVGCVFCESA
jgi:hypothetical protein